MNLPNALTVLRMVLVPVVVATLLLETTAGDIVGACVFTIAAVTDFVDGYLARSRNLITRFGKVMDPIADKLLIASTFVTLVAIDKLSVWVTVIVLAREFAVTGLRMVISDEGRVISASQFGKLKTVLQIVAVLAVIAAAPATWVDVVVWIMVAVTVISGMDYFINVRRRIDEPAGETS